MAGGLNKSMTAVSFAVISLSVMCVSSEILQEQQRLLR